MRRRKAEIMAALTHGDVLRLRDVVEAGKIVEAVTIIKGLPDHIVRAALLGVLLENAKHKSLNALAVKLVNDLTKERDGLADDVKALQHML